MYASTTKLLSWCYLQEELPTTAATDALQLLVSALLQFPRIAFTSSVGLKIEKQCITFLNNIHLFRLVSLTDTHKPLVANLSQRLETDHSSSFLVSYLPGQLKAGLGVT